MNNYMNDMFMKEFMVPAIESDTSLNNGFVSSDDGFLKGNLQMGTYIPYKNMTFIKPVITDERQRKLYEIQKNAFAAHDINLYLDTHPTDSNAIMLYKKYLAKEKELTREFENEYGPLELSDSVINNNVWSWINEPWPWNK